LRSHPRGRRMKRRFDTPPVRPSIDTPVARR
jgi:hypothetical protein